MINYKMVNKIEETAESITCDICKKTFLYETNYVNDISIRDQFLKPINTAGDRVKNNDSTK